MFSVNSIMNSSTVNSIIQWIHFKYNRLGSVFSVDLSSLWTWVLTLYMMNLLRAPYWIKFAKKFILWRLSYTNIKFKDRITTHLRLIYPVVYYYVTRLHFKFSIMDIERDSWVSHNEWDISNLTDQLLW